MTARFMTRRTTLQIALTVAVAAPFGAGTKGHAQGAQSMRIRISFNDQSMTAALDDNPSARDFASMLPLHDRSIDNYANNEKIAYLPRKLTEGGSGPFGNERPGDLCYYAPWGNLALFHAGYHWSRGLIRLGRIDGSFAPLLTRGAFPLQIDLIG